MRSRVLELLVTAKTQRWSPEEFLRTLVEAEIASRDASNTSARAKAAPFQVTKTLDGFVVGGVPPSGRAIGPRERHHVGLDGCGAGAFVDREEPCGPTRRQVSGID